MSCSETVGEAAPGWSVEESMASRSCPGVPCCCCCCLEGSSMRRSNRKLTKALQKP